MQEDLGAVSSRLQAELGGMKRTMLEAVATNAVVTAADVKRYASATLLAATQDFQVGSVCAAVVCAAVDAGYGQVMRSHAPCLPYSHLSFMTYLQGSHSMCGLWVSSIFLGC